MECAESADHDHDHDDDDDPGALDSHLMDVWQVDALLPTTIKNTTAKEDIKCARSVHVCV